MSVLLTFFGAGAASPAAADPEPPAPTIVVVTEDQCRQAVRHTPSADVEYQVGVDVHGRPVAPADLDPGANAIDLPEEFDIAIGVDIPSRRGEPESPRPYEATLPIGAVTVRGDRFYFNGKEFGGDSALRLEQACREFLARKQSGE